MSKLHIPTDEEISTVLSETAGFDVPVFTWRPEDLPHFDDLISCKPLTEDQKQIRVETLRDNALDFCSDLLHRNDFQDNIIELAYKDSAALGIFLDGDDLTSSVMLISRTSLLRPPTHIIANKTFGEHVKPNISDLQLAEEDFTALHHEIGHASMILSGTAGVPRTLEDFFAHELYAESYALNARMHKSDSEENVVNAILARAMISAFKDAPHYNIAPSLSDRFLGTSFDLDFDGAQKLYDQFSDLVHDRLHGTFLNIVIKREPERVLSVMQDVIDDPDSTPEIRKLGQMVLDGASAYMPEALPDNYEPGEYEVQYDGADLG